MLDTRAVSANLRRDLMLKVVAATTDQRWVVDYVRRSLNVPLKRPDGSLGTGDVSMLAGSSLSPVLADLLLYYAFDTWMGRDFPDVRFEHRPDAVAVHCTSERQARSVQAAIAQRLDDVGLKLSPPSIRMVPGRDDGSGAEYGKARPDLTAPADSAYRYPAAEPRRLRDRPSPGLLVPPGRRAAFLVTILFLYFVLTFTHELSPYIVAVQLGVLAAARPLRPRWLPLAMVAIAVGFLLPRLSFVNSHYGLLSSLGSFFGNVAPPSASAASSGLQHPGQPGADPALRGRAVGDHVASRSGRRLAAPAFRADRARPGCPYLLAHPRSVRAGVRQRGGLAGLSLLSAVGRRPCGRSSRTGALSRKMVPRLRAAAGGLDFSWIKPALRWLRAPVALWIVIAMFFVAFFGDDAFDTFPQTEVNAITSFQQNARLGPVYVAEANVPTSDTARYYLFPVDQHLRHP